MRKTKKIIAIMLCFIMFLSFSLVYAENLDTLEDRKNELKTNIEQANDEIDSLNLEITDAIAKVNELEGQIEDYNNSLAEIRSELKVVEAEIQETEQKLAVAEQNYANQKNNLEKRIVAMYEAGETTYLDVLLNSSSITEFVDNYYLIGEIAAIDKNLLNTIEIEKNQIEEIKTKLDANRADLKQKEENEQKTLITLNNAKIQRDNYLANLNEQEKATRARIKEYEQELNNVENEIFIITNNLGDSDYAGGLFAWPTPGYKTITSPFGNRIHPVLGTKRFHTGIDIGAPKGASIIAANSGKVLKAGWFGGYGNAVIIDHGGGFSTLYGHGSEVLVAEGQTVKRRDIIMKVGSTGMSTGPHLHFEVRINGNYMNPLDYLTK